MRISHLCCNSKSLFTFDRTHDPRSPQALCSSNLPKLLERDTSLFIAILGDLFPRKSLSLPSHDSLHRGVVAAVKAAGLQPLKEQMMKIDQLHETLEVRTVRFRGVIDVVRLHSALFLLLT